MKQKTICLKIVSLLLSFIALVSCTAKNGNVTGSVGAAGLISITKVYPTASGPTWTPIVSASRYYIKGLSISVKGICPRGIAFIEVNDGTTTFAPVACSSAAFIWSNVYGAPDEGNKTLTLTGLDISSVAVPGAVATTDVRIDNTAPAAPVITTNGGANYSINGPNLTINGTLDPDVQVVTSSSAGAITYVLGSGTFSQATTYTSGETRNITYIAYDLAGNASSPTSFQVTYLTTLTMILSNTSSSGTIGAQTGASTDLLSTTVSHVGSTSAQINSASTNYIKNIGLSNISSRNP